MAGRHPEHGQRPTLGEIAKIKVGGRPVSVTELRQAISKDRYFDQLRGQLEDEDPTKIAILTYFCENNGPKRFMEVLGEIGRRKDGHKDLLVAYQEGYAYLKDNEYSRGGKFGVLKGRFAESFFADCLNFIFKDQGLRVLSPREVAKFLEPLPKPFPVDGVWLKPQSTHTKLVGVGEYKAERAPHDSRRLNISSKLESQTELRNFLLSKEGKELWPIMAENLPPDLPKEIRVVPKEAFRFYWVVAKGPTLGKQILEKKNVKNLQIPFTVGELDKMTLVLLRNYCRAKQIIM